jgi:hypothetical protein
MLMGGIIAQPAVRAFRDWAGERDRMAVENFEKGLAGAPLGSGRRERAAAGVIRSGMTAARSRGLTTERGVTLYLALAFLLGIGFADDPQYPFAREVLNDPAVTEPRKKTELLYERALESAGAARPRRA